MDIVIIVTNFFILVAIVVVAIKVQSTQNSNIKNELNLTEVTSGRVRQIRSDRADEKPIELVAVSKYGCVVKITWKILSFKQTYAAPYNNSVSRAQHARTTFFSRRKQNI